MAKHLTDEITVRPFIKKFASLMAGACITQREGEYIIRVVKSRMRDPREVRLVSHAGLSSVGQP